VIGGHGAATTGIVAPDVQFRRTPVPHNHSSSSFKPFFGNSLRVASQVLLPDAMKLAWLPFVAAATLSAQNWPIQPLRSGNEPSATESASDVNVNSKYIVESIHFIGHPYQLSRAALTEMQRLIGARLNTEALNKLTAHLRGELRAHSVSFKIHRGDQPGTVTVLLAVDKRFDLSIPRFAYNSSEGWTGIGEGRATFGSNVFTLHVLSDRDTQVEAFAGLEAKYERFAGDRVRLGFQFDEYHQEYDPATRAALNAGATSSSLGAGTYRSRMNFEPSATFVIAKPLTLTVGMSLQQLEPEFAAARSETVNAVVNTLRYHERWQDSDATIQELDAGYDLRAATRALNSGVAYTRHAATAHYNYTYDHQSLEIGVAMGLIYGHAPLFERFILGNSYMLRGWNRYELDPLGGNRLAYGSVTYGYHIMRVFYDTGAVWDQGTPPAWKHSAGIGVSSGFGRLQRGAFLIAVAFPVRQSHVDPVLIAGMNF